MTTEKKIPIRWYGKCVGFIINPTIDNFDFYGKWQPLQNSLCQEFLECIETHGEAEIKIGDDQSELKGTVEIKPDEEIDIKIRPNLMKQLG